MASHSCSSRSVPSQPADVPFQAITWQRACDSRRAARRISSGANWASACGLSAISVTAKRPKCALASGTSASIAVVTGSSTVFDEGVSMPSRVRFIGSWSPRAVSVRLVHRDSELRAPHSGAPNRRSRSVHLVHKNGASVTRRARTWCPGMRGTRLQNPAWNPRGRVRPSTARRVITPASLRRWSSTAWRPARGCARALAELFQVSRTQVRPVLQRLEHEGLVERQPRRGAVVSTPSREATAQIFTARRLVEPWLVRCVCERPTAQAQRRLERVVQDENKARAAGDHRAVVRLSGDFHRVLAGAGRQCAAGRS
jgi:hypothetical protein